jgi:hypothetical protein
MAVRGVSLIGAGLLPMLLALAPVNGNATDWPNTAAGYDTGAIVTVDTAALADLDDAQLRALLDFTGSCGRALLVGISAPVEQVFRNGAGCNGRYLAFAGPGADPAALQSRLAGLPEPPRASPTQLENLLEARTGDMLGLPVLGGFLATYALIVGALLIRVRTRAVALGFCVVASLLVPVIWPGPASRALVAWAEAAAGETVAAYRSLERVSRYEAGDYTAADNWSRGGFAARPALGVNITDEGATLCNRGPAVSAATHLYWRGELYALPPIEPGASWTSVGAKTLAAAERLDPELQLFRQRAWSFDAAWLRPLPMPDADGSGWLLRYASGTTGEDQCAS